MKRARTDGLRSDVWTLPNLISLVRIVLAPVFVAAVLEHRTRAALVVFFAAGISDLLDGLTARWLNVRSKLGMILDPAGDKLLMTAAYIVLTIPALGAPNPLPLALTLIVFGRDLVIVAGALAAYLSWRQTTFPPSLLGKFCTAFQLGTVFLVLLLNDLGKAPGWMAAFYVLTAALTIGSGIDYVLYGLRMLRDRKKAAAGS